MTDRLNYFKPYRSKSDTDEDQLTRAWLAMLRLIPSAQWSLLERIRLAQGSGFRLPSILELITRRPDLEPVSIRTQVTHDRLDPAENVLSVLISDVPVDLPNNVGNNDARS